jgi:hypothetical protein
MASLAAITLLWRGTSLDRIWSLNPTAYRQLAPWDVVWEYYSCRSGWRSQRPVLAGFDVAFEDGD